MHLAGGSDGTVDRGEQQVVATGQALLALGEKGIEQSDEIETLGNLPQGGDVAASSDLGFERLSGRKITDKGFSNGGSTPQASAHNL